MRLGRINYRKYVIGIDEAGRGPLAGPISVGLVIMRSREKPHFWNRVKESKSISKKKREELFSEICGAKYEGILDFKVSLIGNKIIDRIGISKATRYAIGNVLNRIKIDPKDCTVLLDGGIKAPDNYLYQSTIIGGDKKRKIIALASIVAKVKRDKLMTKFSLKHPKYKFDKHYGYGTKLHYKKLKKYGPSPIHRMTYLR